MLDEAVNIPASEQPDFVLSHRELVTDAIVGTGFPTIGIAVAAENQKLAIFIGNQHSPHWRWDRDKLERLTDSQLEALYTNLKVAQHDSRS